MVPTAWPPTCSCCTPCYGLWINLTQIQSVNLFAGDDTFPGMADSACSCCSDTPTLLPRNASGLVESASPTRQKHTHTHTARPAPKHQSHRQTAVAFWCRLQEGVDPPTPISSCNQSKNDKKTLQTSELPPNTLSHRCVTRSRKDNFLYTALKQMHLTRICRMTTSFFMRWRGSRLVL